MACADRSDVVAALKPTVPRAWPGDCGRGSATGAWGAADEVAVFWSNEWLKPGEDDRGSLVLREGSTKKRESESIRWLTSEESRLQNNSDTAYIGVVGRE